MDRECFSCQSIKTYVDKTGRHHWRIVKGKDWCNKCYSKYYGNKTISPEIIKKWRKLTKPKFIKFLGKKIYFSWLVRKHLCSECGVKCEMTDMHHLVYWPCMPWVSMIELCRKCHQKTKNIRNQYSNK